MLSEMKRISEYPELKEGAAKWFHEKWDIPQEAYLLSMEEAIDGNEGVPSWYVLIRSGEIIGGLGVIENDFHMRKDLSPNLCALYVEEPFRNQGLAREMIEFVCQDMAKYDVDNLYLITDHEDLYEKLGWTFEGMVEEEESFNLIRMYRYSLLDI